MKKLALAFVLFAGCSDEVLPEAASALEYVKGTAVEVQHAYETISAAKESLESVYTQLCVPPVLPQALEPCAKVRLGLDKADEVEARGFEALSAAFEAVNAAIEAYNKLNEAVGE